MNVDVIVPIHNEAPTLRALSEGISANLGDIPHRILFVDDGSTDSSMDVIRELQLESPHIAALRFGRNAGKTEALAAAFRRTHAEVVITMDGDLQDDPVELPRMLAALEQGADVVCGWKENRQDPIHKTFPSRVFNGLMGLMFGLKLNDMNTGFKAMRGEVASRLPMSEGMHRFIPVLASQMGYRVVEIPVQHHPRKYGHSKYGFERYYQGLRDAAWLWWHPAGGRAGQLPEPEGLVAEVLQVRGE